MKTKLLLVGVLILSLALGACSSSKNTTESSADLRKKMFNGNWIVTSVEEDKGLQLAPDLTVFGIGDAQCFSGSVWRMVSNNNTGTIALHPNSACGEASFNTVWTVAGDAYNFKFVANRATAKNITTGYSLQVLSIDQTSMSLKTTVSFLNKECPIILHFQKQQ